MEQMTLFQPQQVITEIEPLHAVVMDITAVNHPHRKYIIGNERENLENRRRYTQGAVDYWTDKDEEQRRFFSIALALIDKELKKVARTSKAGP